ncbi:MAG TPA: NlpC/P60 family protein [Pseudolysinimonas sp.]|nr:NlpC/P60 family protein [Pseudolysinimonas sp.]
MSLISPMAALAAPATSYPSDQEVQNAKKSAAAKQAEVAKLTALISQSQSQVDHLQQVAQLKGEEYQIALGDLQAATDRADALAAQEKSAQKKADASAKRAGALVAQMARTGGGNVTLGLLLGSGKATDQLLARLGSMSQLSATSQAILQKAVFDKNSANALARQATVAESKRKDLAGQAQDALAAAQSAASAAEAQVASEQAAQSTMTAQLAELKSTASTLAQQRADGQAAALAAQQQQQHGSGGGGGGGGGGSAPSVPSGSVGQVIAYAEAQLGEPYVIDQAGPNSWDCSGLTMMAYKSIGVGIGGHGSTSQYNAMRNGGNLVWVGSSTAAMRPGDLIFYTYDADNGSPNATVKSHVTIYIGNGLMVEAPYPGSVVRIHSVYKADMVPYVGRPLG